MFPREQRDFLAQFLLRPTGVGAIAPSSRSLAAAMVESVDWAEAATVVEYGPGTGAFTGDIVGRLRPGAKFFAIEINPTFCEALRRRFPHVRIYQQSVRDVAEVCRQEEVQQVDAILCGLPWAAFSHRDQVAYLDAMMGVLRSGGQFATFAYLQGLLLPTARRFRRRLDEYFSTVESSRTVWRNLPPAIVYRCRR
jgi:phosphatidylethanolamine/phosphatidyl-N-methylethanolamine N-methyltransferase